MLTARGVKPECAFQQVFQSTYLFGAFSPIDGDSFLLELPQCNSQNFQLYLDLFSQHKPDELKILVLDNGAFHKAACLDVPPNIALVFLPPYSPELNPAEKIWQTMKRSFSNRLFKTLDALSDFLVEACNRLSTNIIKSTCRFNYIFLDNYWTV